jgi:hypothetical protein
LVPVVVAGDVAADHCAADQGDPDRAQRDEAAPDLRAEGGPLGIGELPHRVERRLSGGDDERTAPQRAEDSEQKCPPPAAQVPNRVCAQQRDKGGDPAQHVTLEAGWQEVAEESDEDEQQRKDGEECPKGDRGDRLRDKLTNRTHG